jgi:AcrR family transcriptional regulator
MPDNDGAHVRYRTFDWRVSGEEGDLMEFSNRDRRVVRTRNALVRAFSALLLEHGYEALTIALVAKSADVGRSTLYEHFRTKDDLLKASLSGPLGALAAVAQPGTNPQGLVNLLAHLRENAAVARVLLTQPLRSRIARVLAERLSQHAGTAASTGHQLRSIAVAEGQLALIDAWLKAVPALDLDCAVEALIRIAAVAAPA